MLSKIILFIRINLFNYVFLFYPLTKIFGSHQFAIHSWKVKEHFKQTLIIVSLWPVQILVKTPGFFLRLPTRLNKMTMFNICFIYIYIMFFLLFYVFFCHRGNMWNIWPLSQDFSAGCTCKPYFLSSFRNTCSQLITMAFLNSSDWRTSVFFYQHKIW